MRQLIHFAYLAGLVLAGLTGCGTPSPASGSKSTVAPPPPPTTSGFSADEVTQALKLYNAKCARCHKFYDPADYTEAEWSRWMTKMAKKAHLKPDQAQLISRYLETFRAAK